MKNCFFSTLNSNSVSICCSLHVTLRGGKDASTVRAGGQSCDCQAHESITSTRDLGAAAQRLAWCCTGWKAACKLRSARVKTWPRVNCRDRRKNNSSVFLQHTPAVI